MRKYESLFIFHPTLEEEELKRKIEQVEKIITDKKGRVENVDRIGRKRLPYPIKKCVEGVYVLINFEIEPEDACKFKEMLLKDKKILRYTVVRR